MGPVVKMTRLQILALCLSLATMRYYYTPTKMMSYLRNLGKILSLRFLKSGGYHLFLEDSHNVCKVLSTV